MSFQSLQKSNPSGLGRSAPLGLYLKDSSPLTAEHTRVVRDALNLRVRRDELATLAARRGLAADELAELRAIERREPTLKLLARCLGDLASLGYRGVSLFGGVA